MITQTDVFLKTLLEESIQDIKNNLWLVDHILWDFTHNPFLKQKYGQKQVDACKTWFTNNAINVFHQYVKDKEKFPCIVITLGSSVEHQEYRTLGDVGTHTIGLAPTEVGQKIPYVVPPFVPTGFTPSTGMIVAPIGTDLSAVSAGMVLLNPVNGNGTPVLGVNGQSISIQPGLELDASQLGVVPQYRYFQTRLGKSFFQENWSLTCATNDPQTLLWLHSIVVFSMLRYREFMEHNGLYEITNFSSTDIFNADFSNAAGEEIYCRQISFSNKVEQTWPRGLHKKLESILLRDTNPQAVTLANPEGYVGGIKIVSNITTPALDQNDSNWYTVEASEEDEDDSDE
jgi:hypothetical protein